MPAIALASTLPSTQVQAQPPQVSSKSIPNQSSKTKPSPQATNPQRRPLKFLPPPLDRGAPGQRTAAASRSSCTPLRQPLTALVPEMLEAKTDTASSPTPTHQVKNVWGLTAAARPTFWVYVPEMSAPQTAEFVLLDDQDNSIYQRTFSSAELRSGIVGVQLPATISPLAIGRRYHWFFLTNCGDTQAFVDGWVQRVELTPQLKQQLQTVSPQQQASLYASQGIWYDALTTVAAQQQKYPKNPSLTADWTELLQAIGLLPLHSEPIVQWQ